MTCTKVQTSPYERIFAQQHRAPSSLIWHHGGVRGVDLHVALEELVEVLGERLPLLLGQVLVGRLALRGVTLDHVREHVLK